MKPNLISLLLLLLCSVGIAQEAPNATVTNDASLTFNVDGPSHAKADTLVVAGQTRLSLASTNPKQLNAIRYTVNNGPEQHYKTPLRFIDEGFYAIKYFLKNNEEAASTVLLLVDTTGPKIDGHFSYINIHVSSMFPKSKEILLPYNSELNINVTDDRSGPAKLSYQLDESPVQAFDGNLRLVAKGSHTLRVTATDLVGNQTPVPALYLIIE